MMAASMEGHDMIGNAGGKPKQQTKSPSVVQLPCQEAELQKVTNATQHGYCYMSETK